MLIIIIQSVINVFVLYSYFLRFTMEPKRSDMAGKLLNVDVPSVIVVGAFVSRAGFELFILRSSGNVGISWGSRAGREFDERLH